MKRIIKSGLTIGLIGSCAMVLAQTTVTLNASADNYIDAGSGGGSLPSSGYLLMSDQVRRVLMSFDVSGIGSDQVVTSAKLRLYGTRNDTTTGTYTVDAYRVTKNWNETGVSWTSTGAGANWALPGGDSVGTTGTSGVDPYGSAVWDPQFFTPVWNEMDVTSLVQEWVSGSNENNGMLLRFSGFSGQLYFVSSEGTWTSGTLSEVPELVVTYEAVPEPTTLALLGLGGVMLARRKRRIN